MADNLVTKHPLGKTERQRGAIKFRLKRYQHPLAEAPSEEPFGTPDFLVSHWGTLANDRYKTGVLAGFAHEEMLRGRVNGELVEFTDWSVLGDYAEITDFAYLPSTDQGMSLAAAASFRRKVGISDYQGTRHQVAGYAALHPRSLTELNTAAQAFGAVGAGFQITLRALAQFEAGEPWDGTRRSKSIGTTYVPIVGRKANGNFVGVVWGRLQEIEPGFYTKYNDESVVFFHYTDEGKIEEVPGYKTNLFANDLRKLKTSVAPEALAVDAA